MVESRNAKNVHRDLPQNKVYMNGATAEPWLTTINPPSNTIMINIGKSQSFFGFLEIAKTR